MTTAVVVVLAMNKKRGQKRMQITLLSLAVFGVATMLLLIANYAPIYIYVVSAIETIQLRNAAVSTDLTGFHNPTPQSDPFTGTLSKTFWNFGVLSGGGKFDPGPSFHAADYRVDGHELVLSVHHDPDFAKESPDPWKPPVGEQYNNVALIGAQGFRPTPTDDIVAKFSMRVSPGYYGTAGLVFEPKGTVTRAGYSSHLICLAFR